MITTLNNSDTYRKTHQIIIDLGHLSVAIKNLSRDDIKVEIFNLSEDANSTLHVIQKSSIIDPQIILGLSDIRSRAYFGKTKPQQVQEQILLWNDEEIMDYSFNGAKVDICRELAESSNLIHAVGCSTEFQPEDLFAVLLQLIRLFILDHTPDIVKQANFGIIYLVPAKSSQLLLQKLCDCVAKCFPEVDYGEISFLEEQTAAATFALNYCSSKEIQLRNLKSDHSGDRHVVLIDVGESTQLSLFHCSQSDGVYRLVQFTDFCDVQAGSYFVEQQYLAMLNNFAESAKIEDLLRQEFLADALSIIKSDMLEDHKISIPLYCDIQNEDRVQECDLFDYIMNQDSCNTDRALILDENLMQSICDDCCVATIKFALENFVKELHQGGKGRSKYDVDDFILIGCFSQQHQIMKAVYDCLSNFSYTFGSKKQIYKDRQDPFVCLPYVFSIGIQGALLYLESGGELSPPVNSVKLNSNFTQSDIGGFRIIKEVGEGGQARVYLATKDGVEYALKRFRTGVQLNEVSKLNQVSSPLIVHYYGEFFFDGFQYLILEYVKGGDLISLIEVYKDSDIPEVLLLQILKQMIWALLELQRYKLIHRDIKPENILITKFDRENQTIEIKLADFGLAKNLTSIKDCSVSGTPYYFAPEVVDDQNFSYASDIYALGATLVHLCNKRAPFSQYNNQCGVIVNIIKTRGVFDIPNQYSVGFKDIISSMTYCNPLLRMNLSWFLNSTTLQNVIIENQLQLQTAQQLQDLKLIQPDFSIENKIINGYNIYELLKSELYGKFYKATKNDVDYLIKVCTINDESQRNIDCLKQLQSQYIVKYIDDFYYDVYKYLVMENVGLDDLQFVLRTYQAIHESVPEAIILQVLVQMSQLIQYLQQQGIVNNYFAPENLLLSIFDQQQVMIQLKMENFDLALKVGEKHENMRGNLYYMAPEVIDSDFFSFSSDIYSLGIILINLANGNPPFFQSKYNHHRISLSILQSDEIFSISDFYSEELRDLVVIMTSRDPEQRLLFHDFTISDEKLVLSERQVELAKQITQGYEIADEAGILKLIVRRDCDVKSLINEHHPRILVLKRYFRLCSYKNNIRQLELINFVMQDDLDLHLFKDLKIIRIFKITGQTINLRRYIDYIEFVSSSCYLNICSVVVKILVMVDTDFEYLLVDEETILEDFGSSVLDGLGVMSENQKLVLCDE